ncbi:3-isopropylmalate dehydratase small subunit [bacterium]|nr:3-isopropylmalate dehydratase small subunit [bacterium]
MKPFVKHTGKVAVLNRSNVDTDQIIPKQFLTKIEKTGFGKHLFYDWRYQSDGTENPDFELNLPQYRDASILIAGDNFGCGSSREHAPWALLDYGFKVIISTSFADIFYNNCFKNGILLIKVNQEDLANLISETESSRDIKISIDLANQVIETPDGKLIRFDLDDFKKETLLQGLDQIAWSLKHIEKIESFEQKQRNTQPWLWEQS